MVLSRKSKEGSNGDIPLSNGITSINSLNASLESSASHSPQDGCLVLGEKAGRGNKYVTRFSVNRTLQKDQVSNKEVFRNACCPCTVREKRTSCLRTTWQTIRAEAFLITLHLGAIAMGAIKEALDYRDYAEDLEIVHTSMETTAVELIIIIRAVSVWHSYKEIGEIHEEIEHIDEEHGTVIHSPNFRTMCIAYTIVSVLMAIFAVATTISFYYLAHLGWTVLSNNFALVIVTVLYGILGERMEKEVAVIREDQHKAVIYESILLLTEVSMPAKDPTQRQQLLNKVERFCRALRDTETFSQPGYIDIPQDSKPKWGAFMTLEAFTAV